MLKKLSFLMFLAAWLALSGPAVAEDEHDNSATYFTQEYAEPTMPGGWMKMPAPPKVGSPKNTMMPSISAEAKMRADQMAMRFNPMSLRQMINMMVAKKKAIEGLSFDDVI